MSMKKTLVIIPAYNEEGNIGKLLESLLKITDISFDIVVINDCSKDNTSSICKSYGVHVIDLPCNLGIGGAVQTGYKFALKNGYDIAIQVDGDGQHPPEYIRHIIQPILNGEADLVIGSRYLLEEGFKSTFVRRLGIQFFSKLIKLLTKQTVSDPTSGFRACNKKVIKLFASSYPKDYPEPETIVILKRNNLAVSEIPVVMKEREKGVSSINLTRSVYYMFKVSLAIIIDTFREPIRNLSEGENI